MLRLPAARGLFSGAGLSSLVVGWVVLAGAPFVACSVDQNGLGTQPKLSAAGGSGSGGSTVTPGSGGGSDNGSGGVTAEGGSTGTGGTGGTGGTADAGAGGVPGTGGAADAASGGDDGGAGIGGTPDGGGWGGVPATGGASGDGSGGAGGMAGAGGTAGRAGTGGTGGTGGRCTALNCSGCCAGTVCVPAPTAQQCGARGAACTACGPCQLCSGAGQCAIDPSSQWTIAAHSARVTLSAPNGGAWDPPRGDLGGAAPDLFCEYENPVNAVTPTTAGVTSTVIDAYSATWDQTITPAGMTVSASTLMAARPAWRIWVGDEDCSTPNNCTAGQVACSYQQPIGAATLMSGALSISNLQSCVSLDLQFTCASSP
jgi:hypothetical protein